MDTPRLRTKSSMLYGQQNIEKPKDVRDQISVLKEHNRAPGVFDYNFPQNFYSLHPEIERESYVTIGGKNQRRVHTGEDFDYHNHHRQQ